MYVLQLRVSTTLIKANRNPFQITRDGGKPEPRAEEDPVQRPVLDRLEDPQPRRHSVPAQGDQHQRAHAAYTDHNHTFR